MGYYLDTTAHLERHGGEEQVRDLIALWLGNDEHSTSTHVEREWKRIVYAAALDILRALGGARSLRDVSARLRQGFDRQPTQRWLVYDMVVEDPAAPLDELERRARRFLRTGFEAMFTERIEVRDGSNCGIAARDVVTDEHGQLVYRGTCKKTDDICAQIAFVEGNRDKILAAADALQESDRQADRDLGAKAQKLMELEERERKGSNCYGGKGLGGDISIAAECEPGEILLTTDQSFDYICKAMGVELRRFEGTRMPQEAPRADPRSRRGRRGRGRR